MLGLMKNWQLWRNAMGYGVWGNGSKPGETKPVLLSILLSSEIMFFSSRYREGASHIRVYDLFQRRKVRVGGRSEWPSCFYCFLKLLQFKIFTMPRCNIWGKHILDSTKSKLLWFNYAPRMSKSSKGLWPTFILQSHSSVFIRFSWGGGGCWDNFWGLKI